MEEKIYRYSEKDFQICVKYEAKNKPGIKSKFEKHLCALWDNAMKTDAFWYTLDDVTTKTIDGDLKFVSQLNVKRFSQRRKPQSATKVQMPFDENKFNFKKVKDKEILIKLQRCKCEDNDVLDEIIINVSPITYGHVLLVPNVNACRPQILDIHGIELAVSICSMTSDRAFCIGFNSLCALASVNHQHFHMSYVQEEIPIDNSKTRQLKGSICCLNGYFINGFALQLRDDKMNQFARDVHGITSWLSENEVAHNVYIGRQKSFSSDIEAGCYVTVYIFPKKPSPEIMKYPFNPAAFEVCGFLPSPNAEQYDSLTEDIAIDILKKYTLTDIEFQDLCKRMLK